MKILIDQTEFPSMLSSLCEMPSNRSIAGPRLVLGDAETGLGLSCASRQGSAQDHLL